MFDHFELLAPHYERLIGPPSADHWKKLLDLPATGRLLDVGGGTGRVSAQLAPFVDAVILCDPATQMLRQAQMKCVVVPALGYSEQLPFADNSFEHMIVVDALHHFINHRAAVHDMVRVLKPGGRLVIEEPDLNLQKVKVLAVMEKVALMRSKFYYPHEIKQMAVEVGASAEITTDGKFAAWIAITK